MPNRPALEVLRLTLGDLDPDHAPSDPDASKAANRGGGATDERRYEASLAGFSLIGTILGIIFTLVDGLATLLLGGARFVRRTILRAWHRTVFGRFDLR